MEEILVCENLTMTFDDGEYIVHALKNVSFSLRKNEVLGIIGESGSGKSTIAKLITGLYQPTGGNIFLGGRSVVRLKRQAQKEVYTKVQMVFQDAVGSFNPRRKIGESISDTLCRLCGEKKHTAGKETARLLEDVGLPGNYAEKYPIGKLCVLGRLFGVFIFHFCDVRTCYKAFFTGAGKNYRVNVVYFFNLIQRLIKVSQHLGTERI